MAQNMFGNALNPQNVVPLDINTQVSYATTVVPPYQNVSSGSYLLNIQPLSDVYLQTTDRGNVNTLYYSFSTASQVLIGTPSSFMLQNKNDFTYFPLVTRFSPFSSTCTCLAWNGLIWVAGGLAAITTGGSSIATSTDGISWTPRDSLVMTGQVYGVAWNGSLWVIVGTPSSAASGANVVATSPDGITWTGRGSWLTQTTNQVQARCATGAFYLPNNVLSPNSIATTLIGQQNVASFYYSTSDALNLIRYPFASGINSFWYAAWNGSIWIATTGPNVAANIVYSSPDGLNWTARTLGATMTATYGVAFSPTLGFWIVVGATGTANANVMYSYDAYTWGLCGNGTTTIVDVQWSPAAAAFMAVGSTTVLYSTTVTNGVPANFTAGSTPTGMTALNSVAYSPTLGLWMVVGTGGSFSVSTATSVGGSWTGVANSLATMTTAAQVAWSQPLGVFVVAGTGVNTIMRSTNGTSFTASTPSSTFTTTGTGVVFNPLLNVFIATGGGTNGPNTFISSTDGANWISFGGTAVDTIGYSVAWSPLLNQWAIVGTGNHTIATSVNGIYWVGRAPGTTVFSSGANIVIWASGLNIWVVGGNATSTIVTSVDGINWVARTSNIATGCYSIAWNGSLLVAGGASGAISTSPDGVNWTSRSQSIITGVVRSITWSPVLSLWVAVGATTASIMTSPNGITWTASAGSAANTLALVTTGNAIVWNSTLNNFVLGGTGVNTLLTSPDGINWTGTNLLSTILYTVYAIAWNGTIWLAGGLGTSSSVIAASSPDGIAWTGMAVAGLTQVNCIAWSGFTNTGAGQAILVQPGNSLSVTVTQPGVWAVGGAGGINFSATGLSGSWSVSIATGSSALGAVLAISYYPYTATWVAGCSSNPSILYSRVYNAASGWTSITAATSQSVAQLLTIRSFSFGVVNGSPLLVGVGTCSSLNAVYATSVNGVTWAQYTTTLFTTGNSIAWSPTLNLFVTVGAGTNTIVYSANPVGNNTWIACNNTLTTSTTTTLSLFGGNGTTTGQGNAVMWNGSIFIAVGQGPFTAGSAITYNAGFTSSTTVLAPNPANNGTLVPYALEATSADGINWRPAPLTTGIPQQNYLSVAARAPITVCGGAGLVALAYSCDNALTWMPRNFTGSTISFSTGCYCVAFNGLIWLAGGAGGQTLLTSKDGVNWVTTGIVTTGLPQTAIFGLAWANSLGLWCAVGYGTNTVATSINGLTWNAPATTQLFNTCANAVGWNGTYFVVTGSQTSYLLYSVIYSRDGLNWAIAATVAQVVPPTANVPAAASIAWNGNVWVLVTLSVGAAANTIYWSGNTFTWNTLTIASLGTSNGSRAVFWNGNLFMVGGAYPNYATSPDGFNWTLRTTLPSYTNITLASVVINTISWNPISSLWLMGITDSTAGNLVTPCSLSSPDAINWTFRMSNSFLSGTYAVRAVVWSSTLSLWAVGGTGTTNTVTLGTSNDGAQITPRVYYGSVNTFYAVAWSGTFFLAGGSGAYLYSSSDGITWSQQGPLTNFSTVYGIAWGSSIWVVVGNGASLPQIASGSAVTSIATITQSLTGNFNINAVASNWHPTLNPSGTTFLAVSTYNGTYNAQYSTTGLTSSWTQLSIAGAGLNTTTTTNGVNAAVFVPWLNSGSGTWVVGGFGATSPYAYATTINGTYTGGLPNNTSLITTIYGLACSTFGTGGTTGTGGGVIVAVGTGTNPIIYSYDGNNWNPATASGSTAIFTNGYTVSWNGTEFLAGGDKYIQATSPDGVNWTTRRSCTTGVYAFGFQQREKTLTINNSQWTGRTSQQNFRILG